MKSLAQLAQEAWWTKIRPPVGGFRVTWEDCPSGEKEAWQASVQATVDEMFKHMQYNWAGPVDFVSDLPEGKFYTEQGIDEVEQDAFDSGYAEGIEGNTAESN